MIFSDSTLSRRLERAEGHACAQFAQARQAVFANAGSRWTEIAGAYAVFDGIDSPITQSFGVGLTEELTPASLDALETFFFERNAPANHEVSPFAGPASFALLCARHYRPTEISSVMYRSVETVSTPAGTDVRAGVVEDTDGRQKWADINAAAWSHEHPELLEFLAGMAEISFARQDVVHFLGETDRKAGATAALSIHDGVALFAGAATIPEMRRRGLQRALLQERLRYAHDRGCDLAMMVAAAGSDSQRNAEREGFRIAYTRMKWTRNPPLPL